MDRDKAIEKAERELSMITYKNVLYKDIFRDIRDKVAPLLVDKITHIKTLEVKCEDLSDMICARDSYIEELQQKIQEVVGGKE